VVYDSDVWTSELLGRNMQRGSFFTLSSSSSAKFHRPFSLPRGRSIELCRSSNTEPSLSERLWVVSSSAQRRGIRRQAEFNKDHRDERSEVIREKLRKIFDKNMEQAREGELGRMNDFAVRWKQFVDPTLGFSDPLLFTQSYSNHPTGGED
jgi:hypothetical protein